MTGLFFSHDAQHSLLAKLEARSKIGLSHILVPRVDRLPREPFSEMIYHPISKCHDLLLMSAMDTGGECGHIF